ESREGGGRGGGERRGEGGAVEEGPVLDRLVDAHQVLVEPAPGADREVSHLAVSHLTRRQPRRLAGGLDRRVREVPPEPVEHRRLRELDRVPRPSGGAAPAVANHQRY